MKESANIDLHSFGIKEQAHLLFFFASFLRGGLVLREYAFMLIISHFGLDNGFLIGYVSENLYANYFAQALRMK